MNGKMIQLALNFNRRIEVTLFEDRLLNILKDHTAQKPIRGPDLAKRLSISTRELRAHIQKLRRMGFYVGSSSAKNKSGYFIYRTEEEFLETDRHLKSRSLSMLKTSRDMMRKTLLDLTGQINIF